MKTLIVSNYYLPGIKGGGPVNSIKNIVERLNGQFDILTKSKDVGEKNKYQNVKLNKWNNHASSRVFYLDNLPLFRINKILKNGNYDTIYLNSLFSTLSIFIILLTIFRNSQIILAPRGELNSSALSMKKVKKIPILIFFKNYFKYKDVKFHATSKPEKEDIQKHFNNNVFIIPNLPSLPIKNVEKSHKVKNKLKIMCVARINKMKNIHFAIERINKLQNGEVIFDIYGSFEDLQYKDYCDNIALNSNIKLNFKGNTSKELLNQKYKEYDLFFLPSLSENYGHSIIEAIQNHVPVLISDNTPWKDLYVKKVGFDISLDNKQEFENCLASLLSYSEEKYNKIFTGFDEFMEKELDTDQNVKKYCSLLLDN